MAHFLPAFEITLLREGGYKLTNDPDDRGGMTFAGISRVHHPDWTGWTIIDANGPDDSRLAPLVRAFYREKFWDKIRGDDIASQPIAEGLYDYAVNAGVVTAVKMAQVVLSAALKRPITPDGVVGDKTIAAFNELPTIKVSADEVFDEWYAIGKIARYLLVTDRDRSQVKFLRGWTRRTLAGVS